MLKGLGHVTLTREINFEKEKMLKGLDHVI